MLRCNEDMVGEKWGMKFTKHSVVPDGRLPKRLPANNEEGLFDRVGKVCYVAIKSLHTKCSSFESIHEHWVPSHVGGCRGSVFTVGSQ